MTQPYRYDSSETGAPSLNNVNGSLIALARAVLINGFNVKAISAITVASGVATVQCPTHGFACGYAQPVRITGASVPALNGDKQPTLVDGNYFTFLAPGVADGSYTATDARRAPLGWTEVFADGPGTKAIFARSAPEAGTQLLRLVDTGAAPASVTEVRVQMLESATGVDTFVNASPTAAQVTDGAGGYIYKGTNTATAKTWALVGNDKGFYFIGPTNSTSVGVSLMPYWFGDGVPFYEGDSHFCLLSVNNAASAGASATSVVGVGSTLAANFNSTAPVASVAARSRNGATLSEVFDCQGPVPARYGTASNMSSGVMPEKLYLMYGAHVVSNSLTKEVRGLLPGLAAPVANLPFQSLAAVSVIGPVEGDGRYYLAVNARVGGSVAANFAIDLTGPWYA